VPTGILGGLSTTAAPYRGEVETRVASIDDPGSLDAALRGADAVIHCAGPFLDTAGALVEASLRAGAHYLDVTAEQGSALSTFEAFHNAARDRDLCVVPAAGFFGAFADLLVTSAMCGFSQLDGVDIAIALDSWRPTVGTRRTGQRNTAARLALRDGELTQISQATSRTWIFPEPFGMQPMVEMPFTETVLLARHVKVREIRNFINEASLIDLRNPATPEPVAVDERGRSSQQFFVDVAVREGGRQRRVAASGYGIYAVTAPIVVETVEWVCRRQGQGGAFAVGELVDAAAFLAELVRRGDIRLTADCATSRTGIVAG
jgi:hypothetical protein